MILSVVFTFCALCIHIGEYRYRKYDIPCAYIDDRDDRLDCQYFTLFTGQYLSKFLLNDIAIVDSPVLRSQVIYSTIFVSDKKMVETWVNFENFGGVVQEKDGKYSVVFENGKLVFEWSADMRPPTTFDRLRYSPSIQSAQDAVINYLGTAEDYLRNSEELEIVKNTALEYFNDAKDFLEDPENIQAVQDTAQEYLETAGEWLTRAYQKAKESLP